MLIKFQSKSAADVLMFKEHAKCILDLLNKDVNRGVITAAESGLAIAKLEAEYSYGNRNSGAEIRQGDVSERRDESGDGQAELVTTATHAYPFLEMLRAAHKGGCDVMWGV